MNPMDPRLQDALDDGRDPGELPADQREAYARLMNATTLLAVKPSLSVADRVMAEVRAMQQIHSRNPWRRGMRWLTRPFAVTLRLRPAWTLGLAAAGLAAILFLPGVFDDTNSGAAPQPGAAEGIAQFVGHFPGARSVEVVGSFNNWSPGKLHLTDENGEGIWHGAAVLPAGQHEYMFLVDGERWVADPLAGRYVDDGFGVGRQNSVLIVRRANSEEAPLQ
ncbi:MAG TPA: isoamylase early set domain-containing protein [Gemmatimonadales bacterium]|nr:isoamylase early set domain-containing protein [Gemmatimonadales bacterium]